MATGYWRAVLSMLLVRNTLEGVISLKSLSNQMLFSCAYIETEEGYQGTGFFYREKTWEDEGLTFLVTNRHVVDGSAPGRFLLRRVDRQGNPGSEMVPFLFESGDWIPHPDGLDLCILPIGRALNEAKANQVLIYHRHFEPEHLLAPEETSELLANEPVVMFGHPLGYTYGGLPIARTGHTATHPGLDIPIKNDDSDPFGNAHAPFGLVDISCHGGSSGSPICLLSDGGYVTQDGFVEEKRLKLLGIMTQAELIEEKLWNSTKTKTLDLTVEVATRLGRYIKARGLRQLVDHAMKEYGSHIPQEKYRNIFARG